MFFIRNFLVVISFSIALTEKAHIQLYKKLWKHTLVVGSNYVIVKKIFTWVYQIRVIIGIYQLFVSV